MNKTEAKQWAKLFVTPWKAGSAWCVSRPLNLDDPENGRGITVKDLTYREAQRQTRHYRDLIVQYALEEK